MFDAGRFDEHRSRSQKMIVCEHIAVAASHSAQSCMSHVSTSSVTGWTNKTGPFLKSAAPVYDDIIRKAI